MSINLNKLDINERKKMFDSFVEAGGKVVNPSVTKKKIGHIQRSNSNKDNSNRSHESHDSQPSTVKKTKNSSPKKENGALSSASLSRIFLSFFKLKSFFLGVTNFGGTEFTPYTQNFMTDKLIHQLDILKKFSQKIFKTSYFSDVSSIKRCFDQDPISIEILLRFAKMEFSETVATLKVIRSISPAKKYYKHLLSVIYPVLSSLILTKKAFSMAYTEIQAAESMTYQEIKIDRKIIDDIFLTIDKRFYTLMNYLIPLLFHYSISFQSPLMLEILKSDEVNLSLGSLRPSIQEFLEQALEAEQRKKREEEEKKLSIHENPLVQAGIDILMNYNIKQLSQEMKNLGLSLPLNDKIYVISLILEVTKEYSMALLSKKMRYTFNIDSGIRFDIYDFISTFFIELDSFKRNVKDYDRLSQSIAAQQLIVNADDVKRKSDMSMKLRYQLREMFSGFFDKLNPMINNPSAYIPDIDENILSADIANLHNRDKGKVSKRNAFMNFCSVMKALNYMISEGEFADSSIKISENSEYNALDTDSDSDADE